MALYYAQPLLGTTNIKITDVYRQKGLNLEQDRTDNFHLSPYNTGSFAPSGSFNYGTSHGREVNPWHSQYIGAGGTERNGGMVQFNDPNGYGTGSPFTYVHQVSLGTLREIKKYYIGFNPNEVDSSLFNTDILNISDGARSLGWNQNTHYYVFFYSTNKDGMNGAMEGNYWVTSYRRSNDNCRISTGRITMDSVGGFTQITNDANSEFTSTAAALAPLNVGQGSRSPYDAPPGLLGSSTQLGAIYRNGSNEKYRIITVNDSDDPGGTQSSTLSVGAEQSFPTTYGNPVLTHGAINMGKGVMWAPMHRGGNYVRIQYLNWTSGTTATRGSVLLASRTSTNTIQPGEIVKASDELAFFFFSRRNGASSGGARTIGVTVLEPSGTNKIPSIRGSFENATYDFTNTDNNGVSAEVGGSNNSDWLTGLVVFGRSGTDIAYVLPWKYEISRNQVTFLTSKIESIGSQPEAYRTRISVTLLGGNDDGTEHYYEIAIPGTDGSVGPTIAQVTAQTNIDTEAFGVTINTTRSGGSAYGSAVQRIRTVRYAPGGTNEQALWFCDSVNGGYTGYVKTLSLYDKTDGTFRLGTHEYIIS